MRYILLFSLLAFSAYAQSVGDFSLNYKVEATGPQSIKSWAKANSALWGTNSSGNPQSITLGSGLSLTSGVLSSSASGGAWGSITGTLSAQTDLQTALDAKQALNANLTTLSAGFGAFSGMVIWDGSAFIKQTSALITGFGGTGISTYAVGDLLYGSVSGLSKLSGNATTTKRFLTQTGDGASSAAPAWGAILAADVPTLNQNTTGTAAGLSSTLAVASGGTGITSFGSGIATWLGTPTIANLNTVLGSTLATTGANTFTSSQTITSSGVKVFDINGANGATSVYAFNGVNWAVYDSVGGYLRSYEQGGVWFATTGFAAINNTFAMQTAYSGLRLNNSYFIGWSADSTFFGTNDLILARKGAATLQLGANAATATAQSISAHSGVGTDRAGADLQILGGQSTGTGTPGNVIIRTATASTTGSSLNAYTTRMTVSPSGVTVGASGTAFAQIRRYSLTMVAGTVTQADTAITANSTILWDRRTVGGTVGHINTSVSAGSSFTINSSSSTETSTFTVTVIIYP